MISQQEGKVDIRIREESWYHNKRGKLISQQEGKVNIRTRGESWYQNKRRKLISQQEGKVDITTRGESWYHNKRRKLISQQEGKVGIPLIDLTPPHCYACHKRGPVFRTSNAVVSLFCVDWIKVGGDCSFCWNWWNCWPSKLFKRFFYNYDKSAVPLL